MKAYTQSRIRASLSTIVLGLAVPFLIAAKPQQANTPLCETVKLGNHAKTYRNCQFPVKLPPVMHPKAFKRQSSSAFQSADSFLDRYGETMGINKRETELKPIRTKRGIGGVHYFYQQQYQGYPVFNTSVSIHQRANGDIHKVHLDYQEKPGIVSSPAASVSLVDAEITARDAAGKSKAILAELRSPTRSNLGWYATNDHDLTLSWELTVYSKNPLGDFYTVINAITGEVLLQENRLPSFETGSGYVYLPNPIQSSGITDLKDNNDTAPVDPAHPLNSQLIEVELQGLQSNTGLLKGQYADLSSHKTTNFPQIDYPDADESTRNYFYNRSDTRFEQVVVYHALDSIQRYIQSLGYSNEKATGIRDYPTRANVHWNSSDKSYYDESIDTLQFGDGGVDDAEDADIIIHEYGHAIQRNQNTCWPGSKSLGHMQAMGEGFSDYLAASFYFNDGDAKHQASHAACIGEWDSTSYASGTPACLRRVDTDKKYPTDLTGEEHADGEIWSRALWDIRLALGRTTADTLILEHHFFVDCNSTMEDAALDVISADSDLNDGSNGIVIKEIFCDRGILSGSDCNIIGKTPADLDSDGDVDITDLALFRSKYKKNDLSVDFNNDGKTDIFDLARFREMYIAFNSGS